MFCVGSEKARTSLTCALLVRRAGRAPGAQVNYYNSELPRTRDGLLHIPVVKKHVVHNGIDKFYQTGMLQSWNK